MIKKVTVAAALLFLVSACGGSASPALSADDQKAISNLSAAFQGKSDPTSTVIPDKKGADCVATSMVTNVGTDALVKYGMLKPDLTVDTSSNVSSNIPVADATKLVDAFTGCVDVLKLMKSQLQFDQLPTTVQTCVDQVLTKDAVRQLMLSTFTGDSTSVTDLRNTLLSCATGG